MKYEIKLVDYKTIVDLYNKYHDDETNFAYGMADHPSKIIYINEDMHIDNIKDTLFHERLHEFIYSRRLQMNGEEDFCTIMERYFYEIAEIRQECDKWINENIKY